VMCGMLNTDARYSFGLVSDSALYTYLLPAL